MTVREETEQIERKILSQYAAFSDSTMGRDRDEPQCELRTVYQRDRDRIIHCKSFRRLKHKTQVFLSPEGDHYRTRLTHTLEVAQISRTIARALRLNEDLTEAIALGHDLGHTPFGHIGEDTLSDVSGIRFEHCEQSVRVVEKIEKDGMGLNLTKEVRDGILNHRTSGNPSTLEGCIVRYSDKIAYINHDIDDAIRAGILKETDIPKEYVSILGNSTKERLNTLVKAVVDTSAGKPYVKMDPDVNIAMTGLRSFMFKNVYTNKTAKSEEKKADRMLRTLYLYYRDNTDKLPGMYVDIVNRNNEPIERAICDYISGMSDTYSINAFKKIYIPMSWDI